MQAEESYRELQELQDYKDELFPNGGGRVRTGGRMGGMYAFLGSLLPKLPTCFECPQYGQAIIFARKCYYCGPQCSLPAFIQIKRLNRILKERAEGERNG